MAVFVVQMYTFIVQELLEGGELLTAIRRCHVLSESRAAATVRQLASAITHLHSRRIVHRDLKPEVRLVRESKENCSEILPFFHTNHKFLRFNFI